MTEYKVLTVRQPWAYLIIAGIKPVENRNWSTLHRGPLLIHAGLKYEPQPELEDRYGFSKADMDFGAIIGRVDVVDVVENYPSAFFTGPFGWVLENARAFKPIPMRGQQNLFTVNLKLPDTYSILA